jgi:hypothetical protein
MNDWDVSLVESFVSLFHTSDARHFNEPLDNWDVSAGKNFVSRIRFNMFTCLALFGSVSMLDAESLLCGFSQPKSCFPLFSRVRATLLRWQCPLIKTSVDGISPRVGAL